MSKTRCFLCQGKRFKTIMVVNGWPIVRCLHCQLVLTLTKEGRRPSKPYLQTYVKGSFYASYQTPAVQQMLEARAVQRLQEIEALTTKGKLLDVGCGYGAFLQAAFKRGWRAEGLELTKKTVTHLKKTTQLRVGWGSIDSLEKLQRFQVICYWDVLEHLPDPLIQLKEAKKHLYKNGILAIQLPNFGSLSVWLGRERFNWLVPQDHINHFTPQTMRLLLRRAGFNIVTLKTWPGGRSHFLIYFHYLFPEKKLLRPIRFVFLKLGVMLDRFCPWLGELADWVESFFLLNGIMIVYAKKN